MQAQIRLGRIWGIELGLHYSWLVIALLVTLSLGAHFRELNPAWGDGVVWAVATVTALLFFTSIVVHELSHAAVARRLNLPVRSITLFALGGIATIEKDAEDAKSELLIGGVGPLTSVLIGLACLGLAWVTGGNLTAAQPAPLTAMLTWLGLINLGLAAFNMIPGYPLDGGRVLRSLVWWVSGNAALATKAAARVGQFVAFGFVTYGIYGLFRGSGIGGLWLAFIGWFLLDAAGASHGQLMLAESLRGLRVGDVMRRDCRFVFGGLDLRTFVDQYLLRAGEPCFAVVDNGRVEGLITAREVGRVERARWPHTSVEDAMLPAGRLPALDPQSSVIDALGALSREGLDQLPVFSNSRLAGLISKEQIFRLLQTRAQLRLR